MPSCAPDSMNEVRRVTTRARAAVAVTGFGAGLQAGAVHRHVGEFLGHEVAGEGSDGEDDEDAEEDSEGGQHVDADRAVAGFSSRWGRAGSSRFALGASHGSLCDR